MPYNYYPMQMHLHAGHEPFSSVEGHIANAAALGMQYIRITEHDIRMGVREFPVKSFDFTRGELMYNDYPATTCGWELIGTPDVSFSENGMTIKGSEEPENGVKFFSSGKRHSVSLLADLTLVLGLKKTNGEGRVRAEVCLSQHPKEGNAGRPIHEGVKLVYALGEAQDGELPLIDDGTGDYKLNVSDDAEKYAIGGLDNAFITLQIICENGAACLFNRFEISIKHSFQPVLDKQRFLADEIGKRYKVKPFVTYEISAAGRHKNCYSTQVPVIDYQKANYNVSEQEAIAHVRKYGGIFSCNHPFETYKNIEMTNTEREAYIYSEAAALVATKVRGASLIEVGFPCGRSNFSINDHLRLWDMLSLSGVFITGYGDSDSHNNNKCWFEGNNFATYIAADEKYEFPVPETEFIASMKAGRVYTGDPVYLKGPIDFSAEGCPMGAIITVDEGDYNPHTMSFKADAVEDNWKMRIIVNGTVNYEETLSKGTVNYSFDVLPAGPVSFARVELYNVDGRCIMLTNPIYLVRSYEIAGEIPEERIYKERNL